MELYIPPPTQFLPRLPPPPPVVPAVPLVPIPDLPETIYAPEGPYTLSPGLFPSIGTPAAPLPFEPRLPSNQASFVGGAGGFIIPTPSQAPPPGQTAMSHGTTVVNGQAQPAHPVRMSWVNIWFPSKGPGERGLGGMFGMGNKGDSITSPISTAPPAMTGYEPSDSSDSSAPPSSDNPAVPVEVPLAAIPQASTSKKTPWAKAGAIPTHALNALPTTKE